MASRKEDEKNERVIRGLLKLPDNRRCINCNSLGPQYICTNFWTFVCTTCSGIHREFTHRVKSISMAKFTSQEVASLQEGGNKRAKEVFFKDWDQQRNSFPDSSNVERLRDFIKHVYVNRRYSGETNVDRPQRVKMGEKEDLSEHRRTDMSQGVSRSPQFSERSSPGGRSDDRNYRYGYDERSPGYDQDRKSPARPDIVDDWCREDRFGNARRVSDGDARSPDTSSPPQVRPIRDILGENVLPPRRNEPPKLSSSRSGVGSVHTQRTASSSSLGSTNDNPAVVKWENSKSLIDFDANPEPPAATVLPASQSNTDHSVVQAQVPPNNSNWACFDFPPVTQPPSSITSLVSELSELSVAVSAPSHTSGVPGGTRASAVAPMSDMTISSSAGLTSASPAGNYSTIFGGGGLVNTLGATPCLSPGQWASMQHQQPSFNTQPSQAVSMENMGAKYQGHLSASAMQAPQVVSGPVQVVTAGVGPECSLEVQSSGRKELPADLFTATYPSYHAPFRAWQTVQPQGMGYTMQYNAVMPRQTLQQSSRSINPFDIANEPAAVQTPVFPSMRPLQGALPNAPQQSGLFQAPALLTPHAPSYMSAMRPVTQYFSPAMPPEFSGPYNIGHQPPSYMPFSGHHQGSIGSEGSTFSTSNTDQQVGGSFQQPGPSNPPPSAGRNPFG